MERPRATGFDDAFADLADEVPVMMWRADREGRLVGANAAWCAFTGRAPTEDWVEALHPDDREARAAALSEAAGRGEAFGAEYRVRRHDGAERWLYESAKPLAHGGEVSGYVGTCLDVTDRRAQEAESAAALEEKEALLAEISHRVRNNLQVMVSLIGLYGRAAPETCRPAFDALGQRVRAIALVQQHLHETAHIAAIDLRDYLQRLATGLGQLHRAGRVSVNVRGEATASIDPRTANALGMVLAEVVAGGLDAGADGATCTVTAEIGLVEGRTRVRLGSGPADGAERAVPRLGPRLIAAYAAQAGIEVEGSPGSGETIALILPVSGALR